MKNTYNLHIKTVCPVHSFAIWCNKATPRIAAFKVSPPNVLKLSPPTGFLIRVAQKIWHILFRKP